MGWNASDPVIDPAANGVMDTITFTHGGPVTFMVALTSPGPWTVIFRLRQGARVRQSILLSSPGGTVLLGPFPEIQVGPGDIIEVVSRDAAIGEHQATLFHRRGR